VASVRVFRGRSRADRSVGPCPRVLVLSELSFVVSFTHCGFETVKGDLMKRLISLEGWIGIVFCIVAALGAMLAESKRLSILEAQEGAHTPTSAARVSSADRSHPGAPGHTQSFSGGLRDIR